MAKHYQGTSAGPTSDTEFIPQVWAEGIYKYFERKSIFRGLIDDYSASFGGAKKGDTIHIPEVSLISASDKLENNDVEYDATASTETLLVVNKHKYVAKLFEDILEIQGNPDLVSKYTRMMGEALSRQMDADIWAELQTLNQSVTLSADDVLSADKFEEALANLGENDVPYMEGDTFMVVNPTLYADILNPSGGLAQYFIRADAGGEGNGLRSGMVGSLYGIDVFMSNTISAGGTASTISGAIFHRSAAAIAVQNDVRLQTEYSIDALGTKIVSDVLYGVKVLDDSDNIRGVKFTNVT